MNRILEQYHAAKQTHPGMLLLFRMGDFYECFAEDARQAAKVCGLTLTTRNRGLAMAGFPHHALEAHLRKLIRAGVRVAVCDPVDEHNDPLRREVTRVVTPGTLVEPETAQEQPATEPAKDWLAGSLLRRMQIEAGIVKPLFE
jgi:DNA mismatch repair protein MutS